MHRIDESFRLKKESQRIGRRRRRRRRTAVLAGLFVVASAALGFYLTYDQWSIRLYENEIVAVPPGTDEMPGDAAIYVPAIVDLPGDPMIINLSGESGQAPRVTAVPRPESLAEEGVAERIEILSDIMISASERFMTTIPSSQEDFAFFQTQRMGAAPQPQPGYVADSQAPQPTALASEDVLAQGAGWGETIAEGEAALPDFRITEIENTTSLSFVIPETERFQATEDVFVRVLTERTLESVALENRFNSEEAGEADEAMREFFGREALEPGYVVALRGLRPAQGAPLRLMQISIYANETYIGSLARASDGGFLSGTDPWVHDDLFHYSGEVDEDAPRRQYRLLDAIYSTAARNQVPTGIIGEAIMHLSRGHDLNAFATTEDRFLLVYSQVARDEAGVAGRVLYVAVRGPERSLECFVFRQGSDFGCMGEGDQPRAPTLMDGMVTPVSGVMTSTFGPRRHPILGTVRIHKGVDWAAPVGTPVMAAFDGRIAFRGEAGEYGNLVRIAHEGGRETRYAHLDRFAASLEAGATVRAGEVIGYVGSTGLSTGPHLHFELYAGGEAIDPLGTVAVATDGSAVEALTERIIMVESAGDARAKNPLSSATGLGQFIDSTWLRMMRTYRPDLTRSLSHADLLALRFDPTISREMVRNLAREGESYLRARGHQITAGRLYLAHFLGMEGAHTVLSAQGDTVLAGLLGNAVISANPFLAGKDASWVVNWAENKMRGSGRRVAVAAATRAPPPSPEFLRYRHAVTELVQQVAEVL